ncbi:MAG: sulfatase, partial [Actinomycetota bacterium]
RDFLKVAGAGAAGAALLGGPLASGCASYLPSGGSRMNVVVVILDSLRKDHVGVYGNDWIETPNLDALAKESLRFTRAYPESIPTIPARRAIYTGIRTWPFRNWVPQKGETFFPAGWQRIPEDQWSVAEILAEEGFYTTLITDTQHQFKASMNFQRGFDIFDFIRGQERDRYRSVLSVPDEEVAKRVVSGNDQSMRDKVRQYLANTWYRKSEEDWFAPQVFRRAGEFLELAGEGQPFFLVVDSFDPHEPWDPPERYVRLYDDDYEGPEPIVPNYSDDSWIEERELRRMRALYAGEVTMTDRWLGEFLNRMADGGFLENTLLFVLADHGVSLAEHGYTGKVDRALWPELTDIPFFIRHPEGKGAGETSDYFASVHDIAPTILSVLDIEPRGPVDGQDLSVILEGKEPGQERPHFTLGYDDYAWTRDEDYAMVCRNDGAEARLYDLREDPNMDRDIAGRHPDVVKKMWNEYILGDAGGPLPRY